MDVRQVQAEGGHLPFQTISGSGMVSLENSKRPDEFLQQLRKEEENRRLLRCFRSDLKLNQRVLQVGKQEFPIARDALRDLAKLTRIPVGYFNEIDDDLQSINFNRRNQLIGSARQPITITLKDSEIEMVQAGHLVDVCLSELFQTIFDSAPSDVRGSEMWVVVYTSSDPFDVSLISRVRATEPQPNDTILGGVHANVDSNTGAIQIGPGMYRLVCQNGALARTCVGAQQHRIRRGTGPKARGKLIGSVQRFAEASWASWERVCSGFRRLASVQLASHDVDSLIDRLQQRPFFISQAAAQRVRDRLLEETREAVPTLYDLHNAATSVGTHSQDILPNYRFRLRLGAGSLARGAFGLCPTCRQFVIDAKD